MIGPNQERWLTELETTDKKQVRSAIHSQDGFCCLGIAAELFKTETTRIDSRLYGDKILYQYDGFEATAPTYVVNALALSNHVGRTRDESWLTMTKLNDRMGLSFKEIATLIRKDPENWFKEPR